MNTTQDPAAPSHIPTAVWICPAIALAVAIAPMPYGYYTGLRIVVCLASVFVAWSLLNRQSGRGLGWAFVGLAILYNPVIVFT